jgi:hypothetical protein
MHKTEKILTWISRNISDEQSNVTTAKCNNLKLGVTEKKVSQAEMHLNRSVAMNNNWNFSSFHVVHITF